jgi:peptide/nickel transport system ATP-binding protein
VSAPLLEVEDLRIAFPARQGIFEAVRGVSFAMGRERLGIVGESGSGKSLTGRALLGLVPRPGKVTAKRLAFAGEELQGLSERRLRQLRGRHMTMVMQDPRFSLNPVMTVGRQIEEACRRHSRAGRSAARSQTLAALDAVKIRDPERVYRLYPHQVSGGMGQRIMIAMMLIPEPELLIADEPTSALDVTVQAQVLAIIEELVARRGMGLILISHDLDLVARHCDRVLIMYAGRVVETCRADRLFEAQHPYSQGLLAAVPRIGDERARLPTLTRDPSWAL